MDPQRWAEIERLYHLAREREAGELEKLLAEACGGDELLRREVESLLARPPERQDFLETPALEVAARALAKDRVNVPPIDMTGRTIAHYRILEKIGEGGMGVVYKARDLHLSRFVALKVLAPEQVADPDRKRRFVQEARAASALNHPNIVTIHDITREGGIDFIVMEYVKGKTLDQQIGHRGLRLNDALKHAVQIADALAKAHSAGIVHRDLKPTNIMVNEGGVVKVLDFGLAKLTEKIQGDEYGSRASLDAEGKSLTGEGLIIGTVSYMSPEQAEGKKVDARSDIFSLGSVLYEMATGQKAFQGASEISTLSAILHQEPKPVSALNPDVPAPLRWIIERCHSKDPGDRYDSTGDLARELANLSLHFSEVASSAAMPAIAPAHRPHHRQLLLGVTAVAFLAVGIGLGLVLARWVNAPELPRFQRVTFRHGIVGGAYFAPGERAIVYSASWEGKPFRVFMMSLGGTDARDLGIEGYAMDISPKGELLVSRIQDPFGGTKADLWLASISSASAPRALADSVDAAAFSPDGSEVALTRTVHAQDVRSRLEFPMGKVIYESKDRIFGGPSVSPDGRHVTVAERGDTGTEILAVDRSGQRSTIAVFPEASSVYAFRGIRGRNYVMRGNDRSGSEVLEVTSSGRIRSLLRLPFVCLVEDITPDGRGLLVNSLVRMEMFVLEEGGVGPRSITWSANSTIADISSDGRTVLFTEGAWSGVSSVYLRRVDGSPAVRLGSGFAMSLSPNGLWALAVLGNGELSLYPTGPGETRTISVPGVKLAGGWFFPKGDRLLLYGSTAKETRCYILPLAGGLPQPFGSGEELLAGDRGEPAVLAPNGATVLLRTRNGWRLVAAEGGEVKPIPFKGLGREEWVLRFREDGKAVFTKREQVDAIVVEAVELETGRRSLVRRLPLGPDAAVSARLHPVCITADGKTVAYSVLSSTSDLYLVEGLK